MLTRLLLNEAPAPAVAAHLGAALAALPKPSGGVRPIAVGSVLRRLAAKAVCKAFSDELRAAAGPSQYTTGRAGGIEILFKALSGLAEARPRAAFLKLDFTDAYNATERGPIQAAMGARLPRLSRVAATLLPTTTYHYWLGEGANAHVVRAERGVDQGCPLSPALFAIALAPVLTSLQVGLRLLDPAAAVYSYLDDVYIVVDAPQAASALNLVETLTRPLGLQLNRASRGCT